MIDIVIEINDEIKSSIEIDGKQHYEYTSHFHNPSDDRKNNDKGRKRFEDLQKKDKEKDAAIKKICHGNDCLRIKFNDPKKKKSN